MLFLTWGMQVLKLPARGDRSIAEGNPGVRRRVDRRSVISPPGGYASFVPYQALQIGRQSRIGAHSVETATIL